MNNGEAVQFPRSRDYVMVNNSLGRGSFGEAVLLRDPFLDMLLVAKKYWHRTNDKVLKDKFYRNFLEEIKILFNLNHRNIVRIYSYYVYESISVGYILMEYIEGSTIGDFIISYQAHSAQVSLDNMFSQLIDAFQYIENHHVIHRDLSYGNIMVDNTGIVKVIDFGVGKIIETENDEHDTLATKINRSAYPQEYYDKKYTSKTDMYHLAELLKRLMGAAPDIGITDFSHHNILDKMMATDPDDRYSNFSEIKEAIDKSDFFNMNISLEDKAIYLNFTNHLINVLSSFTNEQLFNRDINKFIANLEAALRNNCFEHEIQKNSDLLRSVISGGYCYKLSPRTSCDDLKQFIDWFKNSTPQSQQLILNNILLRLSEVPIVEKHDNDLPF